MLTKMDNIVRQMRGICPSFVKKIINDTPRFWENRENVLPLYRNAWIRWLQCSNNLKVIGAESHLSFYTHGIHDAILSQLSSYDERPIVTLQSDYIFYKQLLKTKQHIIIENLHALPHRSLFLFSYPNITNLILEEAIELCKKRDSLIFLDGAYFPTVSHCSIDLRDEVFWAAAFSLSKAFNIGALRIGILFTQHPASVLSIPQSPPYMYYPTDGAHLGTQILNQTSPEILPELLLPYQKDVCQDLGISALAPWFAASSNDSKWAVRSQDKSPPYRFAITDFILNKNPETHGEMTR